MIEQELMTGEFQLGRGSRLRGRRIAFDMQSDLPAVDFGVECAVFAVGKLAPGPDAGMRENGLGVEPDLPHRRLPAGDHVKMIGCCHYFCITGVSPVFAVLR